MLGWRLPRRAGRAPADTQPEPWLSSEVSAESISETSTWRPRAGALALDQRRLDPGHREQPADEVDDRRADLQRRARPASPVTLISPPIACSSRS